MHLLGYHDELGAKYCRIINVEIQRIPQLYL